MNNKSYCIQVFAKAPIEGFCKTRLANDIGTKKAASLQSQMINDTLSRVSENDAPYDIQLWCNPDTTHALFQKVASKYRVITFQQQGDSLGDIMNNAANNAFDNDYKAIFQIGTDCPDLNSIYLAQAIKKIAAQDIVIGPATDGGYVLLAQKTPHKQLYKDIEWGTSQVLQQLQNNIRDIGLQYTLLDSLTDVDTLDDLKLVMMGKNQLGI